MRIAKGEIYLYWFLCDYFYLTIICWFFFFCKCLCSLMKYFHGNLCRTISKRLFLHKLKITDGFQSTLLNSRKETNCFYIQHWLFGKMFQFDNMLLNLIFFAFFEWNLVLDSFVQHNVIYYFNFSHSVSLMRQYFLGKSLINSTESGYCQEMTLNTYLHIAKNIFIIIANLLRFYVTNWRQNSNKLYHNDDNHNEMHKIKQ